MQWSEVLRVKSEYPINLWPNAVQACRSSPWTLATYMVEGGSSKSFQKIKALMYEQPTLLHGMLDKLAQAVAAYLNAQIAAGAQAASSMAASRIMPALQLDRQVRMFIAPASRSDPAIHQYNPETRFGGHVFRDEPGSGSCRAGTVGLILLLDP